MKLYEEIHQITSMNRIMSFLGLPSIDWKDLPITNNKKWKINFDCQTFEKLHSLYDPCNKRLYELLNKNDGTEQEPSFPHFEDFYCNEKNHLKLL